MHRLPKVLTALGAALFLGLTGCNPPSLSDTETHCGNGQLDPGEACDDGNQDNDDACSNACWSNYKATCGDTKKEQREECDDGNQDDTDACHNDCTANPDAPGVCGDGAVTGQEACDDGNTADGDGCPATCGYVKSASECLMSTDPTGSPCPVRLQDLKASITGNPPAVALSSPYAGRKVSLPNVLVIGKSRSGTGLADTSAFYVYAGPEDGGPTTAAGMMVFAGGNGAAGRQIGERVDIVSANFSFFPLTQGTVAQLGSLSGGVALSVKSRSVGNSLPNPVVVTPAQIRTGGARSLELTGQLVEVQNVQVTSANPDATTASPTRDFNEFEVGISGASDAATTAVRVDDASYSYPLATTRALGKRFGAVRGVLTFANDNAKILPQDDKDLTLPGLPSFTLTPGSGNYARMGAEAVTISRTTPLTLTLPGPHYEAVQVTLTSSAPDKLQVPATVTIPVGQTTAQVKVTGLVQTAAEDVTVTATLGEVTRSATVRVLAANEPATLVSVRALSASGQSADAQATVPGGSVRYVVNFDRPVPPNTTVALAVDPVDLGAVSPPALAIPTNAFSQEFVFKAASGLAVETPGKVTAALADVTAEALLRVVIPPAITDFSADATTVGGNATVRFSVTLASAAPLDMQVAIASPKGLFEPTSIVVPKDQTTGSAVLRAADVRANTSDVLTATLGTSQRTLDFSVTVVAPKWIGITVPPGVFPGKPATVAVVFDKGVHAEQTFNVGLAPPAGDSVVPAGISFSATDRVLTTTLKVPVNAQSASVVFHVDSTIGPVRARVTVTPVTAALGSAQSKEFGVVPRVVISEVAGGSAANASDEFVELYNPNDVPVDVTGYRIQYKSATGAWPSATATFGFYVLEAAKGPVVIKPRGYLLLGHNVYSTTAANTVALDHNWNTAITMAGSGGSGHVRLVFGAASGFTFDAANAVAVDRLGWGSAATGGDPETAFIPSLTAEQAAGGSHERKASASSTTATMSAGGADELKGNGRDTDDNSQDFVPRTTRNPQNSASPAEPAAP